MAKKVTEPVDDALFDEPAAEDSGEGIGEGMVDVSASIPEVSETAIVSEDGVAIGPVSEAFRKALPVFLSPVELGEYSAELARQCELLVDIEERKKAANKAFGDQIKDIRKMMDHLTKLITSGSEDRPIECRWEFDYEHGVKKLRRLDTDEIAKEETLTVEDYEGHQETLPLEASIKNAEQLGKDAGETYDVPGSNEIITGDKEPIGRFCQNASCAKFDASVYGNCIEPEEMAGCINYLADVPGTVPRPTDCDVDCVYGEQCPTTCARIAK